MSPVTLAGIEPIVQIFLERELIAGSVTLVAREGRVVHLEAMGYSDLGSRKPMATNSIFRLYSMTKPIVSVALMTLYDEGRFALEDPISKWLPEFSDPVVAIGTTRDESGDEVLQTVPARRPITVRHVLTHTAGLASGYAGQLNSDLYGIAELPRRPDEVIGDFVRRYAAVPLSYHPGEDWEYSRATCVVGRLVEVLSGTSLDDFLRERIFIPLKMVDTHYYLAVEKLDRLVALYTSGPQGRVRLSDGAGDCLPPGRGRARHQLHTSRDPRLHHRVPRRLNAGAI